MEEDDKPPRRRLPAYKKPTSTPRAPSVRTDTSTTRTSTWAVTSLPDVVIAVYLLNPVLAAQCAALSGDVLGRVLPLAALVAAGAGRPGIAAGTLAAATCLWRFYAAALLVPVALILGRGFCIETDGDRTEESGGYRSRTDRVAGALKAAENSSSSSSNGKGIEGEKKSRRRPVNATGESDSLGNDHGGQCDVVVDSADACFDPRYFDFDIGAFLRLFGVFLAWMALFLGGCWLTTSGSWGFLIAAAKEQLLCESLTPNPGLYWYFFAEIFPRFRGFFRVLFLSQPYVYVVPATLRIGMFPEALVRSRYW